jgi:hypothetical protein
MARPTFSLSHPRRERGGAFGPSVRPLAILFPEKASPPSPSTGSILPGKSDLGYIWLAAESVKPGCTTFMGVSV